jgi:hypothetical protein
MKNLKVYLVFALFAAFFCQIKAQDWENYPIKKEKITRNIVLFKTGLTAASPNMIAVNTSKGIVVIDAL